MAGTLYLVGTPIGNLADLSERARSTLASVDVVAAEDTRRTGRLLSGLGLKVPLVSMFEGNEEHRAHQLVERLIGGDDVAVVTDGGMPGISDPGYRVVRIAVDRGVEVRAVPGPSAAVAALVVSGLPTDRFVFEGFLPRRRGEREARLRSLSEERRTLVLFESPRRAPALLRDLIAVLGDRRVALCRELTKLHEEVLRGTAQEVLDALGGGPLRGEVVLVVEGAVESAEPDPAALRAEARGLIDEGMRPREAARAVAARHGASANALYRSLVATEDPPRPQP